MWYTLLLRYCCVPWCEYRLILVRYEGVNPQLDGDVIGTYIIGKLTWSCNRARLIGEHVCVDDVPELTGDSKVRDSLVTLRYFHSWIDILSAVTRT